MHTLTIIQNLNQFYLQEVSYHNNSMPHQSFDQNKMSPDNRSSYSLSLRFLINLHNPSHSLFKLPRLIHMPRLFRLLRTFPIGSKISPAKIFISFSSQNSALI